MYQLAPLVLRSTPLMILFLFGGLLTLGGLYGITINMRDGWQARDFSSLLGFLMTSSLTYFAGRRLQGAWVKARGTISTPAPVAITIWLIASALLAAAVLVGLVMIFAKDIPIPNPATAPNPLAWAETDLQISVERIPRGELTESNFDEAAAERFRSLVQTNVLAELERSLAPKSGSPVSASIDLRTDAQLADFNGRRVISVNLNVPALARGITIIGIDGQDLVQVTCMREGPGAVSIDRGPCFEKLKETFPPRFP